jgi:hypothetical protein
VGRDDVVVETIRMLPRIGVGLGVDGRVTHRLVGKGADSVFESSVNRFVVVVSKIDDVLFD